MPRFVYLVPVLLLALAEATNAQSSYRTILEAQLEAVQDRMSTEGYRPDTETAYTDMIVGVLEAGDEVGLEIELTSGVEYMIMGVCDADCDDLDLTLTDPDGNEITSDALDDAYPVLAFTAPAGGAHILWVTMYDCSVTPCSFGYKVFRR
ncbi:MAG TPA: hypothetical protein VJ788_06350 [Gemmatimonadota bacterium]|nr:hypothetical protein [Gemmatimonadota bacterium]